MLQAWPNMLTYSSTLASYNLQRAATESNTYWHITMEMEYSIPSSSAINLNRVAFRTQVLARHLHRPDNISHPPSLRTSECLQLFSPAELSKRMEFDPREMRKLMDGHNLEDRDWLYGVMIRSEVFGRRERGGKVYVGQDYEEPMEVQREKTMKRIVYLVDHGVLEGILRRKGRKLSWESLRCRRLVACLTSLWRLSMWYTICYGKSTHFLTL